MRFLAVVASVALLLVVVGSQNPDDDSRFNEFKVRRNLISLLFAFDLLSIFIILLYQSIFIDLTTLRDATRRSTRTRATIRRRSCAGGKGKTRLTGTIVMPIAENILSAWLTTSLPIM